MPIDYNRLKTWAFPEVEQTYSEKDSCYYALGVGCGFDPMDERQLRFVYEKDMCALPSMAVVLCHPGFWMKQPEAGVDWVKLVHGEQALTLHRPLQPTGRLVGRIRNTALNDKGEGKGAVLLNERRLFDAISGELVATLEHTYFLRGDGGFSQVPGNGPPGGDAIASAKWTAPETPPEICDLPTFPQAALLYRWSADLNPLHADPAVARAAGFHRPILHGLCTFGVATHAILRSCCDYDPARLRRLSVRFSAPVYPGETIRTEIWRAGQEVRFRARAVERDTVVLNNGSATLAY